MRTFKLLSKTEDSTEVVVSGIIVDGVTDTVFVLVWPTVDVVASASTVKVRNINMDMDFSYDLFFGCFKDLGFFTASAI